VLKKTGSLLLLWIITVLAGELNFSASVDRTTVGVNERLLLTVTVAGENIGGVPSPQLPDLPDFEVGGRSSSQSTNIQFINGKITQQQTITYVYTLYPKRTGDFTIDPCTIQFKGETYQTQPIMISAVKGSAPPPPATGQVPSQPSVPFEDNIKLIATVDRQSVYAGEQVNINFTFYNRLLLANINLSETPQFSGCWVEPIFDAQQLQYQQQTINGIVYEAALIKKAALFPVSSGEITVTSMKLAVHVIIRRGFFNDDIRQTEAVSDPITIKVKPLPDGAPRSFTGGVGTFSMTSSLDQDTSVAAEPLYLTLRISGTGNIRLIEKPILPAIPGVKILDPEVKDNINTAGSSISGYKEFRYPLIPSYDGEYIIPSFSIAYFDIKTKTYKLLETEKIKFVATMTAAATHETPADGMQVLGSDIRHIKDDRMSLGSYPGFFGWWLVTFYLIGCLSLAGSLLYRRHQARLLTDRAYARKLRASSKVKKSLRAAEQALRVKNIPLLLDLLSKVLLSYIGDRFNLDPGAMTKEQLFTVLKDKAVDETSLRELDDLLHQCDVVRYSPQMVCDDPEKLYQTARGLLSKL